MKKLFMAAAISAAFIASPAAAQMYLGAGVGDAKTDDHNTSWKLYGGYQFNPTWGLELGYTDLQQYRGADIESWSASGTGTIPLNERWSLLGKAGVAENRPKALGAGNNTTLLLGVGVGYSLNKNIGLRLEYENIGKLSENAPGGDTTGKIWNLSLKYSL
jgi:OmpA-OmpF porin, OOP family